MSINFTAYSVIVQGVGEESCGGMELPKGEDDYSCVTEDSKRGLQTGGLVLLFIVVGLLGVMKR